MCLGQLNCSKVLTLYLNKNILAGIALKVGEWNGRAPLKNEGDFNFKENACITMLKGGTPNKN